MIRILDMGMHDGSISAWLAEQLAGEGHEVVVDGLELNPDMVEIATKRLGKHCGTVVAADARQAAFHFDWDVYDVVVCFELIEHVPDPGALLAIAERMAKPDTGRVYVSTPDGTFGAGSNPNHLRVYRANDLAELLRRRGHLQDMTVGEDGITVASYVPAERLGEIAIYTGGAWKPWSPLDIERSGLGGSETAAIRLAQELSELGFVVTVYGEVEQGCYRDVVYRHHLTFDPTERRECVISSRIPELFDRPVNARVRMLWAHDVDFGDRLTERRAAPIDHVLVLSRWQQAHVGGMYPFARKKLRRIRNGIQRSYFEAKEGEERKQRLIYTSSPDRGLDVLLEMWGEIRAQVPEAVFSFAYADVYDAVADQQPALRDFRDKVRRLAEQPGVQPLGSLPQPELARLMRTSLVWAHPSWASPLEQPFHETFCLSGDTLIDMPRDHRAHPDGVPIAELEGKGGFPVWAWNEAEHRFTIATANRCWKSKRDAETIVVEFEEGTRITCTPDHKVLTFDGDWVEAGSLQPGDRLRGLNYRFQVNVNLGDGRWTAEHRKVGEWMEGRALDSSEHVHHVGDPTRLDNRPESLEVLPAGEHHSLTHSGREYSREWKARRRALALARKETPEGQAHLHRNARAAGRNLWEWVRSLPEYEREAWLKARAEKAAASRRANMGEEAYREQMSEIAANHRVKSVRVGPTVDVYDMEVAEHHNFVAGGVVVHNCIGAVEAQAAGCVVVASEWGALKEVVKVGQLIGAKPLSGKWRRSFVDEIVRGLTDAETQAHAQEAGPAAVAEMGWDGVARQVAGLVDGEEFAFEMPLEGAPA